MRLVSQMWEAFWSQSQTLTLICIRTRKSKQQQQRKTNKKKPQKTEEGCLSYKTEMQKEKCGEVTGEGRLESWLLKVGISTVSLCCGLKSCREHRGLGSERCWWQHSCSLKFGRAYQWEAMVTICCAAISSEIKPSVLEGGKLLRYRMS